MGKSKDSRLGCLVISPVDLNNTGLLLFSRGLFFEAIDKFIKAKFSDPKNPVIFNNIGVCYFSITQYEDAVSNYKFALALKPSYVEAHNNLGNALVKLFRFEEALASYDQALTLNPAYVEAYWNKALALLQLGRFMEGWVLHESRWAKPSFQPIVRNFPQPIWDGSFSIGGKTLLLHAEQGLGDTLQFVRYVEMVQTLGARLVVEVQAPLVPLLEGLEGVTLVKQGDPLPPFECHCPLMSLPLAFQTTLSSIPSVVPYLKPSPEKERFWAKKLAPTSQLRVGLVWSGDPRHQNDKHRSIPLAELMAALPPGFKYVSLQSEIRDSDRQALEGSNNLVHFGEGRINEAYVPLPDGKSIPVNLGRNSGSNVVVQVIESPGNGGQVSRKNEGGADIIQIMVERVKSAIAGDISRGSGSVPAAMASTYGLNRVAGSY